MTTLDAKADLVTRIHTVLREARDGKDEIKLRAGADLMNSAEFEGLPFEAQLDLAELYSEAALKATGALAG